MFLPVVLAFVDFPCLFRGPSTSWNLTLNFTKPHTKSLFWQSRFLLMLPLLCRSVTKELQGTGADTSSDTQPSTTRRVRTCSSQSPASSTALASFTSTESQVGWSVQQFSRGLQSKGQMNHCVVVWCRLEYMPAKRECHLWSGFEVPSPWLHPQRWKDCRVAEVRAGNPCPGRSYLHWLIVMYWLNHHTIVSTGLYILKAQLPYSFKYEGPDVFVFY